MSLANGPVNGSTAANDAANGGSGGWANLTQGLTDDGTYTTFDATSTIDDVTQYYKVTQFGLGGLPAGSTIDGILVEVKRKQTGSAGLPLDQSIRLCTGGSFVGTDKSTSAAWSSTEAYVSFGGSTDTWGRTWTIAEISDTTFGVGVACTDASTGGWIAYINAVRIIVYFIPPGSPQMSLMGVGI